MKRRWTDERHPKYGRVFRILRVDAGTPVRSDGITLGTMADFEERISRIERLDKLRPVRTVVLSI